MKSYDLAIVGAGIVGLACALAAARRGLRVAVVDRDAHCVGASIRNFGFVTVSGQRRGRHWERARRSRDVWAEVAPEAGIEVVQRGLVMLARRPEAEAVCRAFLDTEMGGDCRMLSLDQARALVPALRTEDARAALFSPHELRVESREAIPKLASWLERAHGVDFHWSRAVHAVDPPRIETSRGPLTAEACVVCPGNDTTGLFADRLGGRGLRQCTLQMLRVGPAVAVRLQAPVMSDQSLGRYEGFADLPEAAPLIARLEREQAPARAAGVHLIAVQSADGSLVVGDSHVYGDAPAPFASAGVDDLILEELDRVLELPGRRVVERWTGTYASHASEVVLVDAPAPSVRIAVVTGGTGASTGFALGEEVIADLLG